MEGQLYPGGQTVHSVCNPMLYVPFRQAVIAALEMLEHAYPTGQLVQAV